MPVYFHCRSKKVVASFPYVPKLYDPALSSLALRYTGRPVGQPQNVYGPQPFAAQPTSHAAQSTPLFVNVVGAKPALNTTIPGYPQLADNNVITINTNSTPHVPVIQPQSGENLECCISLIRCINSVNFLKLLSS